MSARDLLIGRAKIAEQSQRYKEMCMLMKQVAEIGMGLNNDERNLLSTAYKQRAGYFRQSWRTISSIEQKAKLEHEARIVFVKQYRENIEEDLDQLCLEVIQMIDNYLLKSAIDKESQVFYYKMKGDYYRYIAEVASVPEKRRKLVSQANKAYNIALDYSGKILAVNPIKLGLVLNYSVFLYEIKNSERKACKIAKEAFDDAIAQVDKLQENAYKDSTFILQLIRDNLTLWSTAMQSNVQRVEVEEPED